MAPFRSAARRPGVLAVIACICSVSAVSCGRQQEANAAAGDAEGRSAAVESRPPPMRMEPGIPLDLSYIDRKSPAFERFRRWVDSAVVGEPDYGFSAYDAALLYRIEPPREGRTRWPRRSSSSCSRS